MSQGNRDKQPLIPLNALDDKLKNIIDRAKAARESFSSACICRVPKELRKLKESAYTPRLVSIGPLHSKDEHLKSPMQDVKLWYVNFLLGRMTTDGSFACKLDVFEKCVEAMKLLLVNAKKSYTEEVDNLNEEMLVVDGCFILEILYRDYLINNTKEKPNEKSKVNTNELPSDPVFDNPLTSIAVQHDLLLLENQLPLCVLEKLFHITVAKIQDRPHKLFCYVVLYFSHVNSQGGKSTTSNATNCCLSGERVVHMKSNEVYYHMLHIVHDHRLPCEVPEGEYYSGLMPSASNLDYAGVKFGAGTGENLFKAKFTKVKSCLLRCFRRDCFEISTLSLDDSTEFFLRNLIAFEQCCPSVSCYFTSYAVLMDKLVDSEKDVKVLQKAGIIRNNLGTNQEASDLFNKLCKEVVLGKFYFAEECEQATDYSERCWPAFVAHVRREYLATPWTFIAFCVAFIAFGMGVVQFILSFFEVSYAVDEYSVSM